MRRQLLSGAAVRVLRFFSTLVLGFVTAGVLVTRLGAEAYGLWAALGAGMSFFLFLDLGISSALLRFLSGPAKEQRRRQLLSTGVFLSLGAATVVLVVAALVAVWGILPNAGRFAGLGSVALGLSVAAALEIPLQVFQSALAAHFRFVAASCADLARLAAAGMGTAAVFSGVIGLSGMAWCLAGGTLVALGVAMAANRQQIRSDVAWRFCHRDAATEILRYGLVTTAGRLGDFLRFRMDAWIVAAKLGFGPAGLYAIAIRLIEGLIEFMVSALSLLVPVFSASAGDPASLRRRFFKATQVSLSAAFAAGGVTLLVARPLLNRWVGADSEVLFPVLVVLVAAVVTAVGQLPSVNLLYGISKHRTYVVANIVEGIANLTLTLFLCQRYGLMGVALGTAIPMIIMKVVVQPWYVCRAAGIPLSAYARVAAGTFGTGVATTALLVVAGGTLQ